MSLLLFFAVLKHYDGKHLEEKVHIIVYKSIIEGSQGKNPGQKPGGRNWRRSHRVLFTSLLPMVYLALRATSSWVALPIVN